MQTFYDKTVSVRLNEEEIAILVRIRTELSRPGVGLSNTDAVKVALHEWALAHPVPDKAPISVQLG